MEFEGVKFKYENDKLYRLHKQSKKWKCCNDLLMSNTKRISLKINYKKYLLHRLVYLYHNPNWNINDNSKNNFIDHIDRNPLNNKIENLRAITNQQNNFNRTNTKGYYYDKATKKYFARIILNGNCIHLGLYNTAEEAHNVYLNAKEQLHIIN